MELVAAFAVSLVASLLAVVLALYVDERRLPALRIDVHDDDHQDFTYPAQGRVKFFRVHVRNEPFPRVLSWLTRLPAEGCGARVRFSPVTADPSREPFAIAGRWSSTPEVAVLPADQQAVAVLHPETVAIASGASELLDVLAYHDDTSEAFAWSNFAYLRAWRPTEHALPHGEYDVEVVVSTQSGRSAVGQFRVVVGADIDATTIGRSAGQVRDLAGS